MSNIVLPTERRKATDYNPRLMVLFGKPKSGKSSLMASLENNLIIDLEDGYRSLDVMCVQARSANDIFNIKTAMSKRIRKQERNSIALLPLIMLPDLKRCLFLMQHIFIARLQWVLHGDIRKIVLAIS